MRKLSVGRSLLAALAMSLVLAGQAFASTIIFNTMPINPASTPETLNGRNIMNVITVGPSDVTITGFGTFGHLAQDGDLRWVIFSNTVGTSPLFETAPIARPGSAVDIWNDSPAFSFTLLANTTYQLGVMADQTFTYNWDFPGTTVSQGGLTQFTEINGNAENFSAPILTGGGSVVNSLRIFADVNAVPEPSTCFLVATGVAAALARRRLTNRR